MISSPQETGVASEQGLEAGQGGVVEGVGSAQEGEAGSEHVGIECRGDLSSPFASLHVAADASRPAANQWDRTGAPCRCFQRSVSPARPPNRTIGGVRRSV